MKLLLDTHTFLWFIEDSPHLSTKAKRLLESDADLVLSIGSIWEMAVKIGIGKLTVARPFKEFIPDQLAKNEVEQLPITVEHLVQVSSLPLHHRDPFDRLLIAQALVEQIAVVSIDDKFDAYGIKRVW
jgi:PIN domain nuclease of toxin-antitoxin system